MRFRATQKKEVEKPDEFLEVFRFENLTRCVGNIRRAFKTQPKKAELKDKEDDDHTEDD